MFPIFTPFRFRRDRSEPKPHREWDPTVVQPSVATHRERLLAMQICHLKICRPGRAEQLKAFGIRTANDLLWCDVNVIAAQFDAPFRAKRALSRLQTAIRLAVTIDTMTPRDAMLLVAIHRSTVGSLACEHAATLRRDLERFSMSTRGRRLVGRRGIPSLRRLKQWIATSRQTTLSIEQSETRNHISGNLGVTSVA